MSPNSEVQGELIRLRNRIAALEENGAELLRRTEKAEAAVERVRVLHSPEEDPRRTPDCKGCRTVATYTLYEDCKTIAALNAALDAPESPATASTAVSAATEAHGGAGEALEGSDG